MCAVPNRPHKPLGKKKRSTTRTSSTCSQTLLRHLHLPREVAEGRTAPPPRKVPRRLAGRGPARCCRRRRPAVAAAATPEEEEAFRRARAVGSPPSARERCVCYAIVCTSIYDHIDGRNASLLHGKPTIREGKVCICVCHMTLYDTIHVYQYDHIDGRNAFLLYNGNPPPSARE